MSDGAGALPGLPPPGRSNRRGDGEGGALTVEGMTAAQIGDLAARDGLRVHELVTIAASLEDAFMELTQADVVFRPSSSVDMSAVGQEE